MDDLSRRSLVADPGVVPRRELVYELVHGVFFFYGVGLVLAGKCTARYHHPLCPGHATSLACAGRRTETRRCMWLGKQDGFGIIRHLVDASGVLGRLRRKQGRVEILRPRLGVALASSIAASAVFCPI
jgi:hypothetical protein